MNINDLVFESLLDKKIDTLSNQGKHLDQLMPAHREVAHHVTNMLNQHIQQQQMMQQPQSDPQQMMQQPQSDPQQMMQPVMLPPKPNRKINKLIKTLDATRDHLLNLHQRLV